MRMNSRCRNLPARRYFPSCEKSVRPSSRPSPLARERDPEDSKRNVRFLKPTTIPLTPPCGMLCSHSVIGHTEDPHVAPCVPPACSAVSRANRAGVPCSLSVGEGWRHGDTYFGMCRVWTDLCPSKAFGVHTLWLRLRQLPWEWPPQCGARTRHLDRGCTRACRVVCRCSPGVAWGRACSEHSTCSRASVVLPSVGLFRLSDA